MEFTAPTNLKQEMFNTYERENEMLNTYESENEMSI